MAGVSGSEKSDRVNFSSIIGDAACPPRELHRRAGEIPHAFGARLGAARRPERRGNENPAQASHWGGVPESLGGPWVGGCRRTPEGTYNDRPFIEALQAIGPLTLHQPSTMQRVRIGDNFADGIIAKRIVELAKAGERNPDLLCEGALEKLRGHLYGD
jgi:hypothetical protein